MRYAVYYTPPEHHPLTGLAEQWLGRSAFTNAGIAQLQVDEFTAAELTEFTQDPRRYGFHATLKAPFRLADGKNEAGLQQALEQFSRALQPFLQKMKVARIGKFFAIVPDGPSPEIDQLADNVVEAFEPFRAPLSPEEFARRNPDSLSQSQLNNLQQWGYPHVFNDFRFHMTLTGPVPEDRAATMQRVLERLFAPLLEDPLAIDRLALFIEPERAAPFTVHSQYIVGDGMHGRKFA